MACYMHTQTAQCFSLFPCTLLLSTAQYPHRQGERRGLACSRQEQHACCCMSGAHTRWRGARAEEFQGVASGPGLGMFFGARIPPTKQHLHLNKFEQKIILTGIWCIFNKLCQELHCWRKLKADLQGPLSNVIMNV